jgi:hypothetical protein
VPDCTLSQHTGTASDDVASNIRATAVLPLLILLSAIAGICAGLRFRASVLPVLTLFVIGAIVAEGWFRGVGLGTVLLGVVLGAIGLQAGYIVGLWIEQFWRER